jgi:hypothetical protein
VKKAKKSFSKYILFEGRDLNPILEREAVILVLFTPVQLSTEFMYPMYSLHLQQMDFQLFPGDRIARTESTNGMYGSLKGKGSGYKNFINQEQGRTTNMNKFKLKITMFPSHSRMINAQGNDVIEGSV